LSSLSQLHPVNAATPTTSSRRRSELSQSAYGTQPALEFRLYCDTAERQRMPVSMRPMGNAHFTAWFR
jgi:hypothetical protein